MTQPNILFCVADDWGFPHATAYGCSWVKTPNFDRVAANGVLFNQAFTVNAKCAPSRAAILTGRYSFQLEEACNHQCYFPEKFRVYPEILQDAGYFVGFTGKGWAPGNPGYKPDGSVRELTGKAFNNATLTPPTDCISPRDYAANFAEFLDKRPGKQPFCFWYGGHEPHRNYTFGSGIEKGGKVLEDIPDNEVPSYWPDREDVRTDMLDYAFEVEHFDRQLGALLKVLEESGQMQNTLVIVTSDNGPPFPRQKGQKYESSFHEPMAAMWPSVIKPGRIVDDTISFVDLAPTFLEAAGVTLDPQFTGRSFMNVLRAPESGLVDPRRTEVYSCREGHDLARPNNVGYPVRGIRTGQYLYLRNYEPDRWPAGDPEIYYRNQDDSPTKTAIVEELESGNNVYWQFCMGKHAPEELYDIKRDPECVYNLAEDEAYAATRKELCQRMEAFCREQKDPRMHGRGDIFDTYETSNVQAVAMVYKMWQKVKQSGGTFCYKSRVDDFGEG